MSKGLWRHKAQKWMFELKLFVPLWVTNLPRDEHIPKERYKEIRSSPKFTSNINP